MPKKRVLRHEATGKEYEVVSIDQEKGVITLRGELTSSPSPWIGSGSMRWVTSEPVWKRRRKMPRDQPLAQQCANIGQYDRWTCPGCYTDLDAKRPGRYTCSACGRQVDCSLDSEPVCCSALAQVEDQDA